MCKIQKEIKLKAGFVQIDPDVGTSLLNRELSCV